MTQQLTVNRNRVAVYVNSDGTYNCIDILTVFSFKRGRLKVRLQYSVLADVGLVGVGVWLQSVYMLPYRVDLVDPGSDGLAVVSFQRLRGRSSAF